MLRMAYEHNKLQRTPIIRLLKEAPPRSGFFERDQYLAVRAKLPVDLQVVVRLLHTYEWRSYSEALTLQRRQLDLEAGTLRLGPGTTKNDDGRLVYLTQVGRVEALQRQMGTTPEPRLLELMRQRALVA